MAPRECDSIRDQMQQKFQVAVGLISSNDSLHYQNFMSMYFSIFIKNVFIISIYSLILSYIVLKTKKNVKIDFMRVDENLLFNHFQFGTSKFCGT